MTGVRIILLAKAPLPGLAKTRLAPALGKEGAAELARRLLHHAVSEAVAARLGPVELCVTPGAADPAWDGLRTACPSLIWTDQGEGDLGERMARAAVRGLATAMPVLLIGSDCPMLDRDRLVSAARLLERADAVMNPACDGGYVLLGLNRIAPELFTAIPWSTNIVAAETMRRADMLGWKMELMEPLHDVDEPSDLAWLPDRLRSDCSPVQAERIGICPTPT